MTRFARAKGSKSSNEKAPEDGTPWEVMKEQLLEAKKNSEDAKKRQEAEQQRLENYENFLKEQKVQKRQATWCDFPETNQSPKKPKFADSKQQIEKKNKKKKKKENKNIVADGETSVAESQGVEISMNNDKRNHQPENDTLASPGINSQMKNQVSPNKKKNKNKKKSNKYDHLDSTDNQKSIPDDYDKQNNKHQQNNVQKKKDKKFVDGKPTRRKAFTNDSSFQLIINGKDVELVRFEGFPIMKRDAERLEELRNNMIKKGIPKSEVQRTIKLERRRAEKALARLKKDVCYNCRKGGHNLSDCPELKSKIPGMNGADGVCFKCGSTEHRQFECKVQKDKEFRFASCFICREQGHIARQCPDNPKGLYPNGGGCKLCGDVTHLRKDCPTDQEKRIESTVKLQTLEGVENIEGLNQEQCVKTMITDNIKKPKKITF